MVFQRRSISPVRSISPYRLQPAPILQPQVLPPRLVTWSGARLEPRTLEMPQL